MIDYRLITKKVTTMKKHYGSADPREILADLGAALLEMDMGSGEGAIKGFIMKCNRMVTVGINTAFSTNAQNKVLFHETGHLVCKHLNNFRSGTLRDSSFGYRSDSSLISKMENEANFFASDYLLNTDETLELIHEYDLATTAKMLHIPVEFLDYKLRLLYHTGRFQAYQDFLSVRSDCMKKMQLEEPFLRL